MGKYNMGIGIITRKAVKTGTDVPGVIHHQEAETYIILSGSGTLVTGGKIIDPKPTPPDNIINGPSVLGSVRDGYSRKVGPGDVIIIPPGVFHGWSEIPDQVQYLSVRPDPDRVLKAGYINPSLKK